MEGQCRNRSLATRTPKREVGKPAIVDKEGAGLESGVVPGNQSELPLSSILRKS